MKLSELWTKLKRSVIDKDPHPAASEADSPLARPGMRQFFVIQMQDGRYYQGHINHSKDLRMGPKVEQTERFATRWQPLGAMRENVLFDRAAILPVSVWDNDQKTPPGAP